MPGIKLPTAAERLRSLLAAASSLTLHLPYQRCDLIGRHHVDADGRLVLELPRDNPVEPDTAAVVEVTDLIPTTVRATGSRIRSRATLSGWLSPLPDTGEDAPAALHLASAELRDLTFGEVSIEPADFAAATPDPLADDEADLLCHLTDAHPEAVEQLTRLVAPHHLHGVHRVVPIRMDRFGVVLRLEFAARHRDVQLPFSAPLRCADEAAGRMHELLSRARCVHRRPAH